MIKRTFPIITADDLEAVKGFYIDFLGFTAVFDSDWFVDLQAPEEPLLEIGVWWADHELVPPGVAGRPQGLLIDVVVDDVDQKYDEAGRRGMEMIIDLRNEPYGQRRFVTRDPAGTMVEISTPVAMAT